MAIRSAYKPIFVVALTAFIDFVGIGVIIPISPFYSEKFGATPLEIALLFTAYSFPQFLMSPFWGRLSDSRGRKPVLMIGLTGEVVAYLLFAFAPNLTVLFVSRIVVGSLSANLAVIQSYVSDVTTDEQRVRGLGLIGAALGLGFILGPVLGGVLSVYGYRVPILLTAGLAALNLALVHLNVREPIHTYTLSKRSFRTVFNLAKPIYIMGGLVNLAFVGLQVTLALYVQRLYGWGALQVGLVLAVIGVEEAAIQGGFIHKITAKLGEWLTATVGLVLLATSFLILSVPPTQIGTVVALLVLGVALGLTQAPANSLITKLVNPDQRGSALGLVQSVTALTNIFGQIVGGSLFQFASAASPYRAGSIFVLAGLAFFIIRRSQVVLRKRAVGG
jgi:DHA1 family tetracycline resistance protein-like MFS transporter